MKALKVTLMLAVLFIALTSCTKQDLNEDDALIAPTEASMTHQTGNVLER